MHPSILAAYANKAECSARKSFAEGASARSPPWEPAVLLPVGTGAARGAVMAGSGDLQPSSPALPSLTYGMPFAGKMRCCAVAEVELPRRGSRGAPASPAAPAPGHHRVQSIGDTITVSLNCFFTATAPGSKRLTIKIICRRAVDKTLLIASCKFGTDTSTFISHPGNNIPSHQTGRRGKDILQSFCSTSLTKELIKIKECFLFSEIRALWLPKMKHKIAPA